VDFYGQFGRPFLTFHRHEIAGHARVSELCGELPVTPEIHSPSPDAIKPKNASKLLQYLSAIARQITFTENCVAEPQARSVAFRMVSHGF